MQEGDWVVARGMDDSTFSDREGLLTATDLDEIDCPYPIFVLHRDGHECVLNSLALEIVKREKAIKEVNKNFIEQGDNGDWTGRFKDAAVHFIKFNFRQKNEEEIKAGLLEAFRHTLRYGITSVHTDDLNYAGNFQLLWQTYSDLETLHQLPVKVYLHHYIYQLEDQKRFLHQFQQRSGEASKRVKMGAFKIFLDGTFRLHTAALRGPYEDVPSTSGVLLYSQDELNDMLQLAYDNRMQVTMHAVGDAAVEQALNAIDQLPDNRYRHRIIHIQVVGEDLLRRMRESKACIEMQFGFLMNEHDEYAEWLGAERRKYCQLGRSLVDHDVIFTSSSDAPIATLNPFEHFYAATSRKDRNGQPGDGFLPDERLTIEQVFRAHTATPAYLEFAEGTKGELKKGQSADLILLSDHPAECSSSQLKDIKVEAVWIDGELVRVGGKEVMDYV